MLLQLAHKIRLKPNRSQIEHFTKACGTARFAYNWAIANWKQQYEKGDKPTAFKLKKQLNALKKTDFPWMYDVSKCASEHAVLTAGTAFDRFFKKTSKYPTFKKKGKCKDSFYISNDQIKIKNRKVRLPIIGWIRTYEKLRFIGKIMSATVSRIADRWFISILVEMENPFRQVQNQDCVGIDLGISTFATLSDGTKIESVKALKRNLKLLKIRQRNASRKVKGSKNRAKANAKVAKLHYKIASIRNDMLYKTSTMLTSRFGRIAIEDLNVSGMLQNHCLARSIADQGFSEFRRQLEYKSKFRGGEIAVVNRWFASSKICSDCGVKNTKLTLSDRNWQCECGSLHDRDINAAKNIKSYADGLSVNACGNADARGHIVEAGSVC
jgi:putative transposase